MRALLLSLLFTLPALAAEPVAPSSVAPSSVAPSSVAPGTVAPADAARRRPRTPSKGSECTQASDCSCAAGQGKSCLNGFCGCHDPIIIEAVKP